MNSQLYTFIVLLNFLVITVQSQNPPFSKLGSFCSTSEDGSVISKNFFVSNYIQGNWLEAYLFCKAFSMDLASFETLEELNAVADMKKANAKLFTALTLIGGMSNLMNSSDWFWVSNGNKIAYDIPWNTGEPNNLGGKEWCLSVGPNPSAMKFNDISCKRLNSDDLSFICQEIDSTVTSC